MKTQLINSIERLGNGGMEILNMVIPKPNIPADIAVNYKQVFLYYIYKFNILLPCMVEAIGLELWLL